METITISLNVSALLSLLWWLLGGFVALAVILEVIFWWAGSRGD